jgi:hypothetical protein
MAYPFGKTYLSINEVFEAATLFDSDALLYLPFITKRNKPGIYLSSRHDVQLSEEIPVELREMWNSWCATTIVSDQHHVDVVELRRFVVYLLEHSLRTLDYSMSKTLSIYLAMMEKLYPDFGEFALAVDQQMGQRVTRRTHPYLLRSQFHAPLQPLIKELQRLNEQLQNQCILTWHGPPPRGDAWRPFERTLRSLTLGLIELLPHLEERALRLYDVSITTLPKRFNDLDYTTRAQLLLENPIDDTVRQAITQTQESYALHRVQQGAHP